MQQGNKRNRVNKYEMFVTTLVKLRLGGVSGCWILEVISWLYSMWFRIGSKGLIHMNHSMQPMKLELGEENSSIVRMSSSIPWCDGGSTRVCARTTNNYYCELIDWILHIPVSCQFTHAHAHSIFIAAWLFPPPKVSLNFYSTTDEADKSGTPSYKFPAGYKSEPRHERTKNLFAPDSRVETEHPLTSSPPANINWPAQLCAAAVYGVR